MPGFRNPRRNVRGNRSKAVTIIELLIGTTVFLGISFGAYQVYNSSTRAAQESQKQAKYSRGLKTFLERFRHEVENAVQLPNAQSSVMQVKRPSNCYGNTDADGDEGGNAPENLAWGMIPYPGINKSTFPNSLTPFNPAASTIDDSTYGNDAVTMITIPEDSSINFLAYADAGAQTLMAADPDGFIIDGTPKGLAVGDFAVVADAVRKELIRVTGFSTMGSNTLIKHEESKSIWNSDFTTPIGSTINMGQPIVYKVKVITYALDPDTNTLVRDDHTLDDQFNPSVSPPTFGSPQLKHQWEVVASGISKFQVMYVRNDATESETRKPQIGLPMKTYTNCANAGAKANCGCENELGLPQLKTIKTLITFNKAENDPNAAPTTSDVTTESFNPTILKKGLPFMGVDTTGCQTGGVALWKTLDNGAPNPACDSSFCICSSRYPDSLCDPQTEPNHCCGSSSTWNGSQCVSNSSGSGGSSGSGSYGGGGTG